MGLRGRREGGWKEMGTRGFPMQHMLQPHESVFLQMIMLLDLLRIAWRC